jgi:hypothetical protein
MEKPQEKVQEKKQERNLTDAHATKETLAQKMKRKMEKQQTMPTLEEDTKQKRVPHDHGKIFREPRCSMNPELLNFLWEHPELIQKRPRGQS